MNDTQLKKLHQHEIRILDELDRICKKYGLTYYMVGGTLLGAVRHQGFIPWDDDIDIALPREDYRKLMEVADEELSAEFHMQSIYKDSEYGNAYAKIRLNNTLFLEEGVRDYKQHQGIFIDVWPLDTASDDFGLLRWLKKKLIGAFGVEIKRRRSKKENASHARIRHQVFALFMAPFSTQTVIRMMEKAMRGRGDCYVNWFGIYGWKKETIKASYFDPPASLPFEGKEYPAPRDMDSYLKQIYGDDYMQLPPPEKRVTHNPIRLSFDTSKPDEVL